MCANFASQGTHNQQASQALEALNKRPFKDWEITTLYYSALMFTKHHAWTNQGLKFTSHPDAVAYLRSIDKGDKQAARELEKLSNSCFKMRYEPWAVEKITSQEVDFYRKTSIPLIKAKLGITV